MRRRLPPAQRRLVLLTAFAAVGAVALAVVAVVVATEQPAGEQAEYQPFELGAATRVAEIVIERPVFFADPTGGDRGLAVTLLDDDLAAVHVVPPGGTRDCPVDWDAEGEQFEDCAGRAWAAEELSRFPLTVRAVDGIDKVFVDLRRTLPPVARKGRS
jgi:hypothetical protein